ncbi:MAG: Type 1 glutamine amidotransferase-like domain-containing protein [Patescibacteria group bacterium]
MKTFVLHGGVALKDNVDNQQFFQQFTSLVEKSHVKVLLCYWAHDRGEWGDIHKKDVQQIMKTTDKTVEFHIVEDAADLMKRIDDYDVLYVLGGYAELIEPYYKSLSGLSNKLEGKVYIGSSMGAFMASERYVRSFDDKDSLSVQSGLGLVPIQLLCHWDIEEYKLEKLQLLTTEGQCPTLTLDEYRFVVLYQ